MKKRKTSDNNGSQLEQFVRQYFQKEIEQYMQEYEEEMKKKLLDSGSNLNEVQVIITQMKAKAELVLLDHFKEILLKGSDH